MTPISFFVPGHPKTQGSMRAFVVRGKGSGKPRAVVTNDSAKTKPWRALISTMALDAMCSRPPYKGPVEVRLSFYLPRPKAHFTTFGDALRLSAPAFPDGRVGDADKLARACLDALAGVAFEDDALVCRLTAEKLYASETGPGVRISIVEMTP